MLVSVWSPARLGRLRGMGSGWPHVCLVFPLLSVATNISSLFGLFQIETLGNCCSSKTDV